MRDVILHSFQTYRKHFLGKQERKREADALGLSSHSRMLLEQPPHVLPLSNPSGTI